MLQIKFILNKDIDRELWDKCVNNSTCNLIYHQAIYLDTMTTNWDAIVVNNYEAVFPLPNRKKMWIKYVYHPAFTQQLGLCTTNNAITFFDIIPTILSKFKYADLYLNYTNTKIQYSDERNNFVLPLNNEYNYYTKNYKQDLKKNIKISTKANLHYDKKKQIKAAIFLYKTTYKNRHKNIVEKDYQNFDKLCTLLDMKNKVFTRAVYNHKNELLSIALFLEHNNRLYNMMNTTTDTGKKVSANHFLIDKIIEEFSNSNYILDFEGSDVTGIKEFYKNFNPINEPYFYYKINNLSPILKLIKS